MPFYNRMSRFFDLNITDNMFGEALEQANNSIIVSV